MCIKNVGKKCGTNYTVLSKQVMVNIIAIIRTYMVRDVDSDLSCDVYHFLLHNFPQSFLSLRVLPGLVGLEVRKIWLDRTFDSWYIERQATTKIIESSLVKLSRFELSSPERLSLCLDSISLWPPFPLWGTLSKIYTHPKNIQKSVMGVFICNSCKRVFLSLIRNPPYIHHLNIKFSPVLFPYFLSTFPTDFPSLLLYLQNHIDHFILW